LSRRVAVFGSSRIDEAHPLYREAYELGRRLAQAGFEVVTGGYEGAMEAVSRGAREAGGTIHGVTLSLFDPLKPNPWVTAEVRARLLGERLDRFYDLAEAFVVLPGGTGTLLELAYVWNLAVIQALNHRPIILFASPWRPVVDFLARHLIIQPDDLRYLTFVETVADAVACLREFYGESAG